MEERSFDVVVLGGGPGGYPCAIRLGQLGLKVACVEAEEYGGVCLNWGCIPSKALISTAHQYEKAGKAGEQGLSFGSVSLDVAKLQSWKNGIVKKLTGGVRLLLKQNGAEAIEGMGRFVDPKTLEVTRANGDKLRVSATRGIVIATGSATIQVPGFEFDGKQIIGAREAVSLAEVPKRLAVIGGGVIGLELGMVYQAFGAQLTVIELTPSLLPGVDPDAVKIVERSLTKKGGRVLKQAKAERWERSADGSVGVVVSVGGATERVDADVVLVAVGMRPRSRGIGLEEVGVKVDARGFVPTDAECRTNVPGIFAVGDVSGPPMLAHKATKEGEICAEVIAGKASAKDWVTIPGIIFTDPEIATVGLTEAQAKEQGLEVKVGRFPFAALGRAMSIRETDGFVKVLTDKASGRVLGIHIVGPSASDLISEAALALEMVATAEDIALTVHPHPTLGEALMEAAAHSLGHAIHITNR
ncbi:MAG: dihydrolipoyl dehydrogenase [Polyangiaceae bacterium]|nr:dihydrolipoyl dehydrogenase [Polyangiaceae bacterium]MCE7891927.1 dihydrolipoyl dehydrogenase [Sorangiineae bacterium PRO1]MCL4749410.1 dihydrolipoyl dehydrogenase [Myxococcales bacterium]